jgi:hypothetical protein
MIDEEELARAMADANGDTEKEPLLWPEYVEAARAAIAYIVPREREECAKVVSDMPWASVETIAAAIRNMDTQP